MQNNRSSGLGTLKIFLIMYTSLMAWLILDSQSSTSGILSKFEQTQKSDIFIVNKGGSDHPENPDHHGSDHHTDNPEDSDHGSETKNSGDGDNSNGNNDGGDDQPHHNHTTQKYNWTEGEIIKISDPNGESLYPHFAIEHKLFRVAWEGPSTFQTKGGVIGFTNKRTRTLCKLKIDYYCQTQYFADVIDLMWAFCPIYSKDQYATRDYYTLQHNFNGYLRTIGVPIIMIEAIYNGQQYLATTAGKEPWEIQIKISDTFYYRENLLNVAARKARDWQYMLWVDAHQMFLEPYWWEDTIWGLEHYSVLQMFQTLAHVDQYGNKSISWFDLYSTQYAYMLNHPPQTFFDIRRGTWNGNAFGIRKELYDKLGYILDECIAGCCDCAYNIAGFGHWEEWYLPSWPNYGNQFKPWLEKAWGVFGGKVKAMKGRMLHFYHPGLFDWGQKLQAMDNPAFILQNELYRDENFTLHLKDGSRIEQVFPKKK